MKDWSPHLQNITRLEREAQDFLNERRYFEAEEVVLDLLGEAAMALAWIRDNFKQDRCWDGGQTLNSMFKIDLLDEEKRS